MTTHESHLAASTACLHKSEASGNARAGVASGGNADFDTRASQGALAVAVLAAVLLASIVYMTIDRLRQPF